MRIELNDKLKTDFPKILSGKIHITCGDGWYDIIRTLCEQLTKLGGWENHYPQVTQVKEKFGSLNFYVDSATEIQHACISYAEYTSAQTCEVCGKDGQTRIGGWVSTLCEEHAKEKGYEV